MKYLIDRYLLDYFGFTDDEWVDLWGYTHECWIGPDGTLLLDRKTAVKIATRRFYIRLSDQDSMYANRGPKWNLLRVLMKVRKKL